jgi:hypothetical protein
MVPLASLLFVILPRSYVDLLQCSLLIGVSLALVASKKKPDRDEN